MNDVVAMDFRNALIASTIALSFALGAAPAGAAPVTDVISFTDVGTYATNGDLNYGGNGNGYNGSGAATGSFEITFDPRLNSISISP